MTRLLATTALVLIASQHGHTREFVDSENPLEVPPTEPEDPFAGPTPLEVHSTGTDVREYRPLESGVGGTAAGLTPR